MSLIKTTDVLKAAVARLLAYVSDAGDSLQTICNGHGYYRGAPDNVTGPYFVVTRVGGETDPEFNNLKEEFELDILLVDSDAERVELMADLAVAAMITWRVSSAADGLVYGRTAARVTESLNDEVPQRDRHEARVAAVCAAWPRVLTDALT